MGLPGAGKTTLARELSYRLLEAGHRAAIVDGDAVRTTYADFDFSEEGRLRQAERIGKTANQLNEQGITALCSFICPTPETRDAFWWTENRIGDAQTMLVFVDRLISSAYPDTNRLFVPPVIDPDDFVVEPEMSAAQAADAIMQKLGVFHFDYTKPSALLVGRFQPFHDGHKALVAEAIADVGQCVIGVRDTPIDSDNPLSAPERMTRIVAALEPEYRGRFMVTLLPNIEAIVYGRTPGYAVAQYQLDPELEAISGTQLREQGL